MYQQISIAPIQYIIDITKKNMYWETCGMLTYPCKGSVYMFVCVLRFYSYQCALIRIMSLSSSPPSPQPWPQPWPLPSPPLPPPPPPPPSLLLSSCLPSMAWQYRDVSSWCRVVNHNTIIVVIISYRIAPYEQYWSSFYANITWFIFDLASLRP